MWVSIVLWRFSQELMKKSTHWRSYLYYIALNIVYDIWEGFLNKIIRYIGNTGTISQNILNIIYKTFLSFFFHFFRIYGTFILRMHVLMQM